MNKNKIKITFAIVILLLFTLITYFTLDASLRRYAYNKLVGGYKLYQYHIIGGDVVNRDFNSASKKILKYIDFSQKISKGKNNMMQGIVDVTELATSKAYSQEEFNEMENVYIKINEITGDIYKNHVWLARALSDNDQNQAIKHLNKALRLSRSSEEAYREITRLFSKNKKLINLMTNYCENYFNDFSGGIPSEEYRNFFYGSSSIFAISTNENYSTLNQRFINNMNKYYSYEFIFEKTKSLNEFNIIKSFFSGSKVSIRNIVLHDEDKNKIYLEDIIVNSLSSYILSQSNKEIVFLNINDEDDILKFNFKKTYNGINRISLELKLEKLPIVSNSACRNLNED